MTMCVQPGNQQWRKFIHCTELPEGTNPSQQTEKPATNNSQRKVHTFLRKLSFSLVKSPRTRRHRMGLKVPASLSLFLSWRGDAMLFKKSYFSLLQLMQKEYYSFIHSFVCSRGTCHIICRGNRQLCGVNYFLPPLCGFQRSNSDSHTCKAKHVSWLAV